MARYHGKIGYGLPGELVNGVWSAVITERDYYGTVLRASRNLVPTDKVNDDISLSQRISIVADAWAFEKYTWIKYAEWAGSLWTVTTVEIERPRLILTLGGVYDGPRPTA